MVPCIERTVLLVEEIYGVDALILGFRFDDALRSCQHYYQSSPPEDARQRLTQPLTENDIKQLQIKNRNLLKYWADRIARGNASTANSEDVS